MPPLPPTENVWEIEVCEPLSFEPLGQRVLWGEFPKFSPSPPELHWVPFAFVWSALVTPKDSTDWQNGQQVIQLFAPGSPADGTLVGVVGRVQHGVRIFGERQEELLTFPHDADGGVPDDVQHVVVDGFVFWCCAVVEKVL